MYWLDESGKRNAVLDYCDMSISGKTLKKLNKMIFSLETLFFLLLPCAWSSLFSKFVFNSFISGRIPLSCKEIWKNKRYGFFIYPLLSGKFVSLKSQRSSCTKPTKGRLTLLNLGQKFDKIFLMQLQLKTHFQHSFYFRNRLDGPYRIRVNSPAKIASVFCYMTPIPGCGDGGWTLVMKIDGHKVFWG